MPNNVRLGIPSLSFFFFTFYHKKKQFLNDINKLIMDQLKSSKGVRIKGHWAYYRQRLTYKGTI